MTITFEKETDGNGAFHLYFAQEIDPIIFPNTPGGKLAYANFVNGAMARRGDECTTILDRDTGQAFGRIQRVPAEERTHPTNWPKSVRDWKKNDGR